MSIIRCSFLSMMIGVPICTGFVAMLTSQRYVSQCFQLQAVKQPSPPLDIVLKALELYI